ncbi:MAG: hypothetical protein ACRDQD_11875 [Nocardioidaceae bacterium]
MTDTLLEPPPTDLHTERQTFYLTFGSQYGTREAHPRFHKAHADGWVTVIADDYAQAREYVTALFGRQWSDLYTARTFLPGYFPLGELLLVMAPPREDHPT